MYQSQSLGHELLKRADSWRHTEEGGPNGWEEEITRTANALINGDAIIVDKPRTFWQRIALLWSV